MMNILLLIWVFLGIALASKNLFAGIDRLKYIYNSYYDYKHFHFGFDFANSLALKYIKGDAIPPNQYYFTDDVVYPPFQAAFQSVLITLDESVVPVYQIERREDYVYVFGFPSDPKNNDAPILLRLKSQFLLKNSQEGYYYGNKSEEITPEGVSDAMLEGYRYVYETAIYRAYYWDTQSRDADRISAVVIGENPVVSLLGYPMNLGNGAANVLFKFEIDNGSDESKPIFNPFFDLYDAKDFEILGKEISGDVEPPLTEQQDASRSGGPKWVWTQENVKTDKINLKGPFDELYEEIDNLNETGFVPEAKMCYGPTYDEIAINLCGSIVRKYYDLSRIIESINKEYISIEPEIVKCVSYDNIVQQIKKEKDFIVELDYQNSLMDPSSYKSLRTSITKSIKSLENQKKEKLGEVSTIIKRVRKLSSKYFSDSNTNFVKLDDGLLPQLEQLVQLQLTEQTRMPLMIAIRTTMLIDLARINLFFIMKFYTMITNHKNGIPPFSESFELIDSKDGKQEVRFTRKMPPLLLDFAQQSLQSKHLQMLNNPSDLLSRLIREPNQNWQDIFVKEMGYPDLKKYSISVRNFCKERYLFVDKRNMCTTTADLVFSLTWVSENLAKDYPQYMKMKEIIEKTPKDSSTGNLLLEKFKIKEKSFQKSKGEILLQCLKNSKYDDFLKTISQMDTPFMPFCYDHIYELFQEWMKRCQEIDILNYYFQNSRSFAELKDSVALGEFNNV